MDSDHKQEIIEQAAPFVSLGIVVAIWGAVTWIVFSLWERLPEQVPQLTNMAKAAIAAGVFAMLVAALGPKFLMSVDATLQGVVKLFGRPVRTVHPGLCWMWWPFEKIAYVPRGRLELAMFFESVVTCPGRFTWPGGIVEDLDRLSANITVAVYTQFADDEKNLFQAVSFLDPGILADSQIQIIRERLRDYLNSSVDRAVREIGGGQTWGDLVNRKGEISKQVQKFLRPTPTFDLSGLGDNLEIAIQVVALPPEFIAAQTAKAAMREKAEAVRRESEGTADATKRKAEGDRYQTEQAAEADKKRVELAAAAEATRLEVTLKAIGLEGEARSKYLLAEQVAKRFPEGTKIISAEGLPATLDKVLKALTG